MSIFYNFKRKLHEAEGDQPDEEAPEEQSPETVSDLEKVLKTSPKVLYTLTKLLSSQSSVNDKANKEIREIVSDIKIITFRPTTFRIVLKNANYFDLMYDPTPSELANPNSYSPSDFFRVIVAGKRYDLGNKSSFEQALDYIGQAMALNPIDSNNPDIQQQNDTDGGGDLPPEIDKPKA
jgi:hypothetical protein